MLVSVLVANLVIGRCRMRSFVLVWFGFGLIQF